MLEAAFWGFVGAAALGLAAGATTFFVDDWLIDRQGGHRRKSPVHGGVRPPGPASGTGAGTGTGPGTTKAASGAAASSGMAAVLGALLDGIPRVGRDRHPSRTPVAWSGCSPSPASRWRSSSARHEAEVGNHPHGTCGGLPSAVSIGLPAACHARIPPVMFATS